ncbi:MAG: hypothetical protein KGJ62_04675 [Armatimonadetes bacterium]|nr:hypothetical protein [Armatimonadota bacterium]
MAPYALAVGTAGGTVQTDLILGRGISGPYTLTWRGLEPFTETVTRDSQTLMRGTDYDVDPDAGTITFVTPLGASDVARVIYEYDPLYASRNPGPPQVPLSLGIGGLTLTAQLHSGAAMGSAGSPTPFALTGSSQVFRGNTLSGGLFLNSGAGTVSQAGGLHLLDQANLHRLQLTLGYSAAGSRAAGGADPSLRPGAGVFTAAGTYSLLSGISLSAQQTSVTSIASAGSGAAVAPSTQRTVSLSLAPPKSATALQLSSSSSSTGGGATETTSLSNTASLQQKFSPSTQAGLTFSNSQATTAQGGSATSRSQATGLSISSVVSPELNLSGALGATQTAGTNGLNDTLNITASPFGRNRSILLTAGMQDQYLPSGGSHSRSAILTLPGLWRSRASLSGGIEANSGAAGNLTVGVLNANTQPFRYLSLQGGARLRFAAGGPGGSEPNALDSWDLGWTLAPSHGLSITGATAANPSSSDLSAQPGTTNSLGMTANVGSVSLTGTYSAASAASSLARNLALALGVKFTRWDALSAGVSSQETFGSAYNGNVNYTFGFTHQLGSLFDLSLTGGMQTWSESGVPDPSRTALTGEAKIGIHF